MPRESTEHKLARYFDVCVVALYDGGHMTLGLSCAFQIPPAIAAKVMGDEAMDLSEATVAAGYSKDGAIGSKGGLIGALTHVRRSQAQVSNVKSTKLSKIRKDFESVSVMISIVLYVVRHAITILLMS